MCRIASTRPTTLCRVMSMCSMVWDSKASFLGMAEISAKQIERADWNILIDADVATEEF